jgi:RNA polymerase sigma-70 factor, ECF subfamily
MSSQEQHLSDTDLAMSAQAGSMAAFEELVFRYEGRILRFLRHRAASQEDAEDMAQETFVTACQKIARSRKSRRSSRDLPALEARLR